MKCELFDGQYDAFRAMVCRFFLREVLPEYDHWQDLGAPPREFWLSAGRLGLLEQSAFAGNRGTGAEGLAFSTILFEEAARAGIELEMLHAHVEIAVPMIQRLADHGQAARWLPATISGRAVATVALPRSSSLSDIGGTCARAVRDGHRYIVYGAGGFTWPGSDPDLIITPVHTDLAAGPGGLSLLVIDADSPRLSCTRVPRAESSPSWRPLELAFDDVVVSGDNLLGRDGWAREYLMECAIWNDLSVATRAVMAARTAMRAGTEIGHGNDDEGELAECRGEIERCQQLLVRAVLAHHARRLSDTDAAHLRRVCSRLPARAVNRTEQTAVRRAAAVSP